MRNVSDDVVNCFWHGRSLPTLCLLCLKSFVDHGFRLNLFGYERITAPAGVTLCDAEDILPKSRIFTYQTGPGAGSPSAFSNLFRYKLLLDRGGWWVDTDTLCLGVPLPSRDVAFAWEDKHKLGNAVLKLPANHELAKSLYVESQELIAQRSQALQWGEIGPDLLTRVARQSNVLSDALPPSSFYPVHYSEADSILRPERAAEVEEKIAGSVLAHLWHEMLRRNGDQADAHPPAGSFLDMMYRKHGIVGVARTYGRQPIEGLEQDQARLQSIIQAKDSTLAIRDRTITDLQRLSHEAHRALTEAHVELTKHSVALKDSYAQIHYLANEAARLRDVLESVHRSTCW
jgi:hypothetical protein